MTIRARAVLVVAAAVTSAACAGAPTYMRAYGARGAREARLGWVLLVIAMAVIVIVTALVIAAAARGRSGADEGSGDGRVIRSGGGLRWIIVGGIVVPTVVLFGVLFFSLATLAATASPPAAAAVTIQVIGHRWWWEVRYQDTVPGATFVTANELHIPVGSPVRLELTTADVIHSFWVPQLAGKTDLIPGQRNVSWIEADSAGTYWGQCGEYCGQQHAHMQLFVVAEPPATFERWRERQRQPAVEPTSGATAKGRDVFTQAACSLCHAIRGTSAGGALGPDLTHLASRRTIAAGVLQNTTGNLAGWIASPQGFKPGTIMPPVPLTPEQLQAIVQYLQSLE